MSLLLKKRSLMSAANVSPVVTLDVTIEIYELVGADVVLSLDDHGDLVRTLLTEVTLIDNWVDEADKGGNYDGMFEVMLSKSAGTDPSTGPSLANWHTITGTIEWTWGPTDEMDGTLDVREILDTGNTDSATIDVKDIP